MTDKKIAPQAGGHENHGANTSRRKPTPTGQAAQVLQLIQANPGILCVCLNIEHGITQAGARIHELRASGFNIISQSHECVFYAGRKRRNVVSYSLGSPEWPRPGFFAEGKAQ